MQEHFPSASNESAEKPSLSLTAQEWQTLHMSDDPSTDPEVMAIMAAKNIGFDGGPMDVTVAGAEEGEASRQFVMSTSLEDPFTRDRALSEKAAERLSSPEQQDEPSVADKLGDVVGTYGEESTLEHVLDDASQEHKDQVASILDKFNERLPHMIAKYSQEDELIGNLQSRISNRLGSVTEMLARSAQLRARDVEAVVNEIYAIGKNMDIQLDDIKTKRGVLHATRLGASEVRMNVRQKTDEYRAIINHLTENAPNTDRDERPSEAMRTDEQAVAGVTELAQNADVLETKLRGIGGATEEHRQALRTVQNRLVALHDMLNRTGSCDPNELRSAKLKLQEIQESHGQVGLRLKVLPAFELPR